MKVCVQCGALFLAPEAGYECKACTNAGTYDDSGDGMHSVPLRDLNDTEREALARWLEGPWG